MSQLVAIVNVGQHRDAVMFRLTAITNLMVLWLSGSVRRCLGPSRVLI